MLLRTVGITYNQVNEWFSHHRSRYRTLTINVQHANVALNQQLRTTEPFVDVQSADADTVRTRAEYIFSSPLVTPESETSAVRSIAWMNSSGSSTTNFVPFAALSTGVRFLSVGRTVVASKSTVSTSSVAATASHIAGPHTATASDAMAVSDGAALERGSHLEKSGQTRRVCNEEMAPRARTKSNPYPSREEKEWFTTGIVYYYGIYSRLGLIGQLLISLQSLQIQVFTGFYCN